MMSKDKRLKSESLHKKFGIDEENLGTRRKFIQLTDADREVLMELIPWAEKHAPIIAKDFYDYQFEFAQTRMFFEAFGRHNDLPIDRVRQALEGAQAGYYLGIFTGAKENWGTRYFEGRLHIGAVHDVINMPFKWYIGSYTLYDELTHEYLVKSFPKRAAFVAQAEFAIRKVMNYDIQAVGDSFQMQTLESMGLSVEAVKAGDGQDRTESLDQVKVMVDTLKRQADAIAAGRFDDESLRTRVPGALGETFSRAVASLQQLLEQAQAIAQGKLDDAALDREVPGMLGDAFKQMSDSLNGIVVNIRESTDALGDTGGRLQSVSKSMTKNAEETAAQANSASAASEEVSKSIQTIAAGADEMNSTIKEVARNVAEAAKIAKDASQMAESTNAIVSKLSESSEQINNVVKVITDIAEQTNLLALNATIEAARAGEAGKGFAVVANEVKELAKETTRSTSEIRSQVKRIQDDTAAAVDAIQKIGAIIRQINDTQTMIGTAVEEQTATTSEISHNIAEAAKGSGDISRSIGEVASAAKSTEASAADTTSASNELSRMTEGLKSSISIFRVRHAAAATSASGRSSVAPASPRAR